MRSSKTQGYCDTTQTERFEAINCTCDTYPGNLGPCGTYLDNYEHHCVYCDHSEECHELIEDLNA